MCWEWLKSVPAYVFWLILISFRSIAKDNNSSAVEENPAFTKTINVISVTFAQLCNELTNSVDPCCQLGLNAHKQLKSRKRLRKSETRSSVPGQSACTTRGGLPPSARRCRDSNPRSARIPEVLWRHRGCNRCRSRRAQTGRTYCGVQQTECQQISRWIQWNRGSEYRAWQIDALRPIVVCGLEITTEKERAVIFVSFICSFKDTYCPNQAVLTLAKTPNLQF